MATIAPTSTRSMWRSGDAACQPLHDRIDHAGRKIDLAELTGIDRANRSVVLVEDRCGHTRHPHRPSVGERGVGVGQLQWRDDKIALTDREIDVVTREP